MIPFDLEESTGAPLLDRIFRRLRETLESLKRAVTNERLIAVTFTAATTDTPVRHGLGAPVLTWEVVDRDADVSVWRSTTVNPQPRDVLILQASGVAHVLVRVM